MFEVKRPEEKSIVVIRAATPLELSNYEKWKLESKRTKIAFNERITKSKTTSKDSLLGDLFLIECTLED